MTFYLLLIWAICSGTAFCFTKQDERFKPDACVVNWQKVHERIAEPPAWWQELIDKMLLPYKREPALLTINGSSYAGLRMPARFTIKQGTLKASTVRHMDDIWKTTRFDIIEAVVQMLLDQKCITQDVDFLLDVFDINRSKKNVPVFMFSKNKKDTGIILMPDAQIFAFLFNKKLMDAISESLTRSPWHMKKNIIFWRGIPHDAQMTSRPPMSCPRSKLVAMNKQYPFVDAGFNDYYSKYIRQHRELEAAFGRAEYVAPADQVQYKYLIAIDGVTVPFSGFVWPLMSNSVVLKQDSDDEQWFHHMLEPYKHYVPIKRDMSDIPGIFNWLSQHDDQAELIAHSGRDFALAYLTLEDHLAYLALLISAYAQLQGA